MLPSLAAQAVSPFPNPPPIAAEYTNERISQGGTLPPPAVQKEFTVFGEEYKFEDEILRSLQSQGIRQLYPSKNDWKTEMKNLNRSAVAAFLDLLEILARCPDSPERARDMIRLIQKDQLNQLKTSVADFKSFLQEGKEVLAKELTLKDLEFTPVPKPKPITRIRLNSEDEATVLTTEPAPTTVEKKAEVLANELEDRDDMWRTAKPSMDSCTRRLMKELQQLQQDAPTGIRIRKDTATQDLKQWRVDVIGATGTLYAGEEFTLQFTFGPQYPFNSPEVMFVGDKIPVHPHIYSNGHICLSILSEDWTPALSVQSVCLSILSMLSSSKEKKHPTDDAIYVRTCSKNPSKTRWWFHDDNV
ncbi:unnamed protein product [Caenorhabditis auriculariae]|uniref:N-terminal E2 ubiquitin-conjugating enzyme n=1 Tax=Caenorhabditis auriculariae TaxID=2777116 RepID=A0A8S1HCD3_9PELO|nr:unnamed protein product [Caenorhabditis auriculariae]